MENYKMIAKERGSRDDSAIARSYLRYTKAQRLDQLLSAENFIETEQMPKGYISLESLLDLLNNPLANGLERLRKFAKSLNYEVIDTFFGYAITTEAAAKIRDVVFKSVAIRPVWQKYCAEKNLPAKIADYHAFLRLIERNSIAKYRFHPLSLETEYLFGSQEDVEQVVGLIYENESATGTVHLMRPARVAEYLRITRDKVQEWIAEHSEYAVIIAGVSFVKAEMIDGLLRRWNHCSDIAEIDWFGYRELFDSASCSAFRAKVQTVICEELREFILPAGSLPQQKASKSYVDNNDVRVIEKLLSEKFLVPISAVAAFPNISERHIRDLVRRKEIDAEGKGKSIFLTPKKYAEIGLLATNNVPLGVIINQLLLDISTKFEASRKKCQRDLIDHCTSSNWWGLRFGKSSLFGESLPYYVVNADVEGVSLHLKTWLLCYGLSHTETFAFQLNLHKKSFPTAVDALNRAFPDDSVRTKAVSEMADMLFYLLCKKGVDINSFSKEDFARIVDDMRAECSIAASQACIEFLGVNGYFNPEAVAFKRIGEVKDVSAYPVDSFVVIGGAICSRVIWDELNLIEKAIGNRVFAQLWLFVAVHLFAALRITDYERLAAPKLTYPPDKALAMIRSGTYPEEEARRTCIMFESLNSFRNMRPNKTAEHKNILPIYFCVPHDLEIEFGLILTIAIAHYELNGRNGKFIVSHVERNKQTEFFGPIFTSACDNKAFSGRRMNKALMSLVSMVAQEELGLAPDIAYAIASALRSHKGNYASLSETTYRYVGNGPLAELNYIDTLKQLYRRGPCSFILDSMLRKCQGADYSNLPTHLQTDAIVALNVSPYEATSLATEVKRAMIEAERTVAEVIADEYQMTSALHRLISGEAVSKDGRSGCLLRAVEKTCVRQSYQSCMGCPYEIRTKAQYVQYYVEYSRQHEEIDRCRAEISRLEIKLGGTFQRDRAQTIVEEISVLKDCQAKATYLRDKVLLPCLIEIAVHIQELPDGASQESFRRIKNSLENFRGE